jgi:hypothetical protein
MPRYFFHLESPNERIIDTRGQILPDERSAEREAVEVAVALRRRRGGAWAVIVTNDGDTKSHRFRPSIEVVRAARMNANERVAQLSDAYGPD